jgi:hypothetical protein
MFIVWFSTKYMFFYADLNFIRNMGSIKSVISKKKDLYSFYNMVPCLKIDLEVVVFLDLRKIQNTVQSTYNEKLVILNK